MRKVIFLLGIAVGYVIGTRAGRERYEQMVKLGQQAASHPAVVNARQQATAKAADLGKTAASKAPDLAKNAVPKVVGAARSAKDRLPFTGKSDDPFDEATDGADPTVPYQANGSAAAYDGVRAEQ